MHHAFNPTLAPFDRLTASESDKLAASLDIAYFPRGRTIIAAGERPDALFVVVKGTVAATQEAGGAKCGPAVHLGPDHTFDALSLTAGRAERTYTAVDETVCYAVPRLVIRQFLHDNPTFAAYFAPGGEADAGRATDEPVPVLPTDLSGFLNATADDGIIHKPLTLPQDASIGAVVRAMRRARADCCLIDGDGQTGILTNTNLLDALALHGRAVTDPAAEIARYDLIGVEKGEFLFTALAQMTRHSIERVVVFDRGRIAGVLELTDILSRFSTQSHLISARIAKATRIDELAEAATGLTDLVRALLAGGARMPFLMDLLAALNGRIMGKLYEMIVPAEALANSCLVVLGSEGRGEQILKTDQDNALVLRDGFDWPSRADDLNRFGEALAACGYPPCPGGVMVINASWVRSVSDWRHTIKGWGRTADGDALMRLAILADAAAVAGDEQLLAPVQQATVGAIADDTGFLARFASIAVAFDTPLGPFGRIGGWGHRDPQIDLKKAALFPIVHGLRCLAIETGIGETNSHRRIAALAARGHMKPEVADALDEAIDTLTRLRVRSQLLALDAGTAPDNKVTVAGLDKADADALKQSLKTVKAFKQRLTYHFKLDRL